MIKTIIRNLLKPLSFLPAILMMYLIFSFSSQDGTQSAQLSYKVSYKIVEIGGELLGADFEPWEIESLANRFHGPVRKIAHMTEYFALAVSVAFPLYVYGLRGILLMIVAGIFCVGFACADEYHQAFVDGRGPSKKDVLIDSIGVFFGIILVRIVGWTGRKTIFRPLAGKAKRKNKPDVPAQATAAPPLYTQAGNTPGYPPYSQTGNTPGYPPANGVSVYPPPASHYQGNWYSPGNRNSHQGYQSYSDSNSYVNGSYTYTPYNGVSSQNIPPHYSRQPHPGYYEQPSYGYPQQGAARHEESTSDQLSEDMSLKKLMHDLKEQKTEQKKFERKPKLEKSDLPLEETKADTDNTVL